MGMPFLDVHVGPNHSLTAYSYLVELVKIAGVNYEDVVSWNQKISCQKRMSKIKEKLIQFMI